MTPLVTPLVTTANSVNRAYTDAYRWPGRSPFEVALKSFPPCIHTRFISEYFKSSLYALVGALLLAASTDFDL